MILPAIQDVLLRQQSACISPVHIQSPFFPQISLPTNPVMQSARNRPNDDAEIVSQVGKVAVIMINFDAWQVSV
jgi:hypothetical protein